MPNTQMITPLGCLDCWDEVFAIVVGGKRHHFAVPPGCSLFYTNAAGDPLKREPSPRDPFWEAADLWWKQGSRVVDGLCVWEHEPPIKIRHLGGGHYEVVEPGSTTKRVVVD